MHRRNPKENLSKLPKDGCFCSARFAIPTTRQMTPLFPALQFSGSTLQSHSTLRAMNGYHTIDSLSNEKVDGQD